MSLTHDRVRDHILQFGWNSTCFQVVNPGITHWWSSDSSVLIGYVLVGRIAVVAGAPICLLADLEKGISEWEAFVVSQGWDTCYFGAEERLQGLLKNRGGYTSIILGSQPEWTPESFTQRIQETKSLRAQVSRARNHGVTVCEWEVEHAESHPALQSVLAEWLSERGLPTLGFLVEPNTLDSLKGRRIFVAERNGAPVAFTTLCPATGREGWLTEQFVRSSRAPNGTVEALLNLAARTVAESGDKFFTMGIVPLLVGQGVLHQDPRWLALLRAWAKAHYRRFYNFRGLMEFKSKFRPDRWTPVLVVVRGSRFRWRHLRAVARAFTKVEPEVALVQGIIRAGKKELHAAISRLKKTSVTAIRP
ncbi:MAG: DUF2156 domain-containing protein [Fimbriimonadaceae bacterium]|nr:DUF2156 domain-containing protein [Fimbriimonadaceae bacterium]